MARNKRPDEPKKGPAPWLATFADLMNLLLCFFVLLFSMSSVDAEKYEQIAASFTSSFSIFDSGGSAIGEGTLISSGVSQLNDLEEYTDSMGKSNEGETNNKDVLETVKEQSLQESEKMAEEAEQLLKNYEIEKDVEVDFTSHYISLTVSGALLFDSGSADIREESYPVLDKLLQVLQRFEGHTIEIEGHTDNVPINTLKYRDNDELSSFRALTIFKYVVEKTDLDPAKLKHSGRGEYVPIADNATPEGRQKNRRVEIKIYNSFSD